MTQNCLYPPALLFSLKFNIEWQCKRRFRLGGRSDLGAEWCRNMLACFYIRGEPVMPRRGMTCKARAARMSKLILIAEPQSLARSAMTCKNTKSRRIADFFALRLFVKTTSCLRVLLQVSCCGCPASRRHSWGCWFPHSAWQSDLWGPRTWRRTSVRIQCGCSIPCEGCL